MTSESRSRLLDEGPGPESFRAFFEALPRPAVLCDGGLRPRAINAAFRRFCLEQGATVEEVLGALEGAEVPEEGASGEVEVALPGGLAVVLELVRSGSTVSVVARPGREPEPVPGEQERTEELLRALGRGVAEAAGEEELVATVARGVRAVFPGRFFCIRIIDARTGGLTSLYAEGRLKGSTPEPLVLKRSAVEKLQLASETLPFERVAVAAQVPLLFEDSLSGVSAPLVANGQLYGSINLEYPASLSGVDVRQDDRVLAQLANQVAVAVKNAKLIDELTFVRRYLEELLEKANALILVVNRDKQIVVFNQALSKLTGFTKEEVLGRDARWVLPEEERLRLGPLMGNVMRGEALPLVEVRLRTRTGEAQASFATSTMLNAQGELEGIIAIGQDVTVVKELEQRVSQSEKLASLGQLAASVAHEINNPMTAVVSYADALLQDARLRGAEGAADAEKLRKIR
ncbi:MAG TPA: PAS domain S-box protein, partial [Myxococcaceae bacterium]|nr:PAS domain S-box protein [Myxococcaceae bacterium]